jgi:hypothetical protein
VGKKREYRAKFSRRDSRAAVNADSPILPAVVQDADD